jgi:hypothetical protein
MVRAANSLKGSLLRWTFAVDEPRLVAKARDW